MPVTARRIVADVVGIVSTGLGGLLTLTPRTGGRWLGLTATGVAHRRALGVADLALGVTILAGRRSGWRWAAVAARSALHLVFAREYLRAGRPSAVAAMGTLFVVDAGVATALRHGQTSS